MGLSVSTFMRYPRSFLRFVRRLRRWRAGHVSDYAMMFFLAAVVGLLSGGCAYLLKCMIGGVTHWMTQGMKLASANWQLLVIPVLGIVLTGIFVRYVVRLDITQGTDKLLRQLKTKDYFIRARVMIAPMLGSVITLGLGGSAGAEGPIAYTGAAIGSNSARLFGLKPDLQRTLLGCGAGAGIAGIFKSPIGGFLFTIEVLRLKLTTSGVVALLVASVTAGLTAYVLSGCNFDLGYGGMMDYRGDLLGWYILLGLICGAYGVYYSRVMDLMSHNYGRIRNPWLRNLSGGIVLAVSLFLFPSLYGEGYGVMGRVLGGDPDSIVAGSLFYGFDGAWQLVLVAVGIWLLKPWAASASNSAGGVAGDFAPTLFAGCMVGACFALAMQNVGYDLPMAQFAYLGMGAVMAGAIRAPLMALFITVEMTATFSLLWPMFIVTSIAFGMVRLLSPGDFYSLRPRPRKYPTDTK